MHRPISNPQHATVQPQTPRSARRTIRVTATIVVAGALIGMINGEAFASHVSCGETITADTKLHSDLRDCPGNGIVIGSSNITLDLNGHTIDGDGAPSCSEIEVCDLGVDNTAGHNGVTINDGSIREFATGIFVAGASDNRLTRLTSSKNLFGGLLLVGSLRTHVERSVITANGLSTDEAGMIVFDSQDSHIQRNTVADNGDIGMLFINSDNNRAEGNSVFDNPEAGLIFTGNRNSVSRNRVFRNGDNVIVFGNDNTVIDNDLADAVGCPDGCGSGISLEGGERNVIARNVVRRSLHDGIRIAAFDPTTPTLHTVVRDNRVHSASDDAISVATTGDGAVNGTLVDRNRAIGSGDDGLDIRSTTTTLSANRALRNADLGIDAVLGVTDGGDNKAHANGNSAQCAGVACS